jgi:hypothetical protein
MHRCPNHGGTDDFIKVDEFLRTGKYVLLKRESEWIRKKLLLKLKELLPEYNTDKIFLPYDTFS